MSVSVSGCETGSVYICIDLGMWVCAVCTYNVYMFFICVDMSV